jgi:ribosomal protein S10
MKYYQITITSKNKKSLEQFSAFIYKRLKKLQFTNKFFQKKTKNRILTILKSPHVNKKSQEQFNYNLYSKHINFYFPQNFKVIKFIKTIKLTLFLDVNITIKLIINEQLEKKIYKNIFNPVNFKLQFLFKPQRYLNKKINTNINFLLGSSESIENSNNKKQLFKNLNKFLKINDIYGELF